MKLHAFILRAKKSFGLHSTLLRASVENVIVAVESDTLIGAFDGVVGDVDQFKSCFKTSHLMWLNSWLQVSPKPWIPRELNHANSPLQSQSQLVLCVEMSADLSGQLIPSV